MNQPAILLVEDDEDDIFLARRAFADAGLRHPVHVMRDGQAAIDYLSGAGGSTDRDGQPIPLIIFLDLNLPVVHGLEVLQWIRARVQFKQTVVVALTGSDSNKDLAAAYQSGANSFLRKPLTSEKVLEMTRAHPSFSLESRFEALPSSSEPEIRAEC